MTTATRPKNLARLVLSNMVTTLETFSSVVLLIMMVLTFVDVVGRYVLGAPVFGATEMISSLLALLIFAGLGIANTRDDHIVVELFDERFRSLSPFLYEFLIQAFSIAVMALIAFVLFEQALENYEQNALTVVLEIPLYYITGSIAFLAMTSLICQVLGIILRSGSSDLNDQGDGA